MAGERILHAKEERRPASGRTGDTVDYPFLILVLLLLAVGLTMLYSASYAQSEYDTGYEISTKYLQKQGFCALIGLAAMFFFSRIPVKVWYRFAWPLYGVSIVRRCASDSLPSGSASSAGAHCNHQSLALDLWQNAADGSNGDRAGEYPPSAPWQWWDGRPGRIPRCAHR